MLFQSIPWYEQSAQKAEHQPCSAHLLGSFFTFALLSSLLFFLLNIKLNIFVFNSTTSIFKLNNNYFEIPLSQISSLPGKKNPHPPQGIIPPPMTSYLHPYSITPLDSAHLICTKSFNFSLFSPPFSDFFIPRAKILTTQTRV